MGSYRFVSPTGRTESALSVRDIGEEKESSMRKATKYTDEPLGQIRVIKDFLPPPSELVFKEDTVKVTLGLSRRSVDFFKKQARKYDTQYQKMIRRLLDLYVTRQQR
jgi:predicted DNA binding CopG/RHH family protein